MTPNWLRLYLGRVNPSIAPMRLLRENNLEMLSERIIDFLLQILACSRGWPSWTISAVYVARVSSDNRQAAGRAALAVRSEYQKPAHGVISSFAVFHRRSSVRQSLAPSARLL